MKFLLIRIANNIFSPLKMNFSYLTHIALIQISDLLKIFTDMCDSIIFQH
jgi:hypothetical protein